MDLVPAKTGQLQQTMSCLPHAQMTEQSPDDVFAAGSVTAGHSLVSMPSSNPAYHLLESFGEMPRWSIMIPGNAREFVHVHATFLLDTDLFIASKQKRAIMITLGNTLPCAALPCLL